MHKEIAFEAAIEQSLLHSGWYKEWSRLLEFYGMDDPDGAQRKFAHHVAKQIDDCGALDVLRRGVKDRGVLIRLAYFHPAHTIAEDALVLFAVDPDLVFATTRLAGTKTRSGLATTSGSIAPSR